MCVRVRGLNGEPGLHLPEEVASLLDLLSAGEKKRESERKRERAPIKDLIHKSREVP